MDLPDDKQEPDAADESDDPLSTRERPNRRSGELQRFRGVPLGWQFQAAAEECRMKNDMCSFFLNAFL